MKIIGCYIVKNEAEALSRSLQSIRGQVDELVVVDTGSTDNSVDIAQKAGAKIYHYAWQDDFAAARNYALNQLQGDWVVFLDADEYFSEVTAGNLRQVIEEQDSGINVLLVSRQDVEKSGTVLLTLYVPRIFRIDSNLRYEGAVHEELRQGGHIVNGIEIVAPEVLELIHTGYAGSRGEAKARRNLTLLLRELEHTTSPERLYGYLAEAYDGVNDRENSMKYAYLDIGRGRQAETYASRSYRLLMAKLAESKRDYRERQRVAGLAVKDYPELPEFHAELAESMAVSGNYRAALGEMKQALDLGGRYTGMEPTVFDEQLAEIWQKRCQDFTALEELSAKMKISACVIVKNEERNIGKWLKTAKNYADECVVLDTGSTDGTCALVEKEGIVVHQFGWQGDFAAARNAVLDKARGDWVTFFDADEILDSPELLRSILAEWEYYHPEAEVITITGINVDADDGDREISRFPSMRIFRNKLGLRYDGRVHETLICADGRQPTVGQEERLYFLHTGYSTSVVTAKIERNLALLQEDMKEYGEQPRHYRYLADCYYSLGKYEEAQLYALRAIEAPLKGVGTQGDMYYMVLQCMKARHEPVVDQIVFAEAARRKFPGLPDFPAILGILCHDEGRYRDGEVYLSQALQLAKNDDGRESSSFGELKALTFALLADCHHRLGKREEAMVASETAMTVNPYEEQVLTVYCVLRQGDKDGLIAKLANYFSDSSQDIAFLCRFCERNGFGDLYRYYRVMWEKIDGIFHPRQTLYQLLNAGEWEELTEALRIELAQNVERMFHLLLRLEERKGITYRQIERQVLALLPAEMLDCWLAVCQDRTEIDWQIYKTIWNYVMKYGEPEQIFRFALISRGNKEIWQSLVADLLEREKWQTAVNLLAKIPVEQANGKFWQDLGQCLYHLGDYEAAGESLQKARQAGQDNYLLQSYEHWLEGRRQND